MKKVIYLIAAAAMSVSAANAFDVPRSVSRVGDMEKVVAEATKNKKGIVFVHSDSKLKPS